MYLRFNRDNKQPRKDCYITVAVTVGLCLHEVLITCDRCQRIVRPRGMKDWTMQCIEEV